MEAIRIDLPRTFPENVFFENIRTPLFNVLVAYANHNKEIGYCQGLNYIAGECPSVHRPFEFENKIPLLRASESDRAFCKFQFFTFPFFLKPIQV